MEVNYKIATGELAGYAYSREEGGFVKEEVLLRIEDKQIAMTDWLFWIMVCLQNKHIIVVHQVRMQEKKLCAINVIFDRDMIHPVIDKLLSAMDKQI